MLFTSVSVIGKVQSTSCILMSHSGKVFFLMVADSFSFGLKYPLFRQDLVKNLAVGIYSLKPRQLYS